MLALWGISVYFTKITQAPCFVLGRRRQSHSGIDADDCTELSFWIVWLLFVTRGQKFSSPIAEASHVAADYTI